MRFHSDLAELDGVIRRLAAVQAELDALAARLDRRLGVLHDHWDGAAATSHLSAQAHWDGGFATMRAALADMRSAADTARGNYAGAADANLTMWRELG